MKTSPSSTPLIMQAVRSTSRKTCGTLARKTDASPWTADCLAGTDVMPDPVGTLYDRHALQVDPVIPQT